MCIVYCKFSKCKLASTKLEDATSFFNNDNSDLLEILEKEQPVNNISFILEVLEDVYKSSYKEILDQIYPPVTDRNSINRFLEEIGFKTSSEFYNKQYTHLKYEDDKLLPYFNENHKYEFVKATQGCGKTHCSLDYIQQNQN